MAVLLTFRQIWPLTACIEHAGHHAHGIPVDVPILLGLSAEVAPS